MRSAGFTVQNDAIRSALSFIGTDSDASITLHKYRLHVRSASGLAVSRNRECAYFSLLRPYTSVSSHRSVCRGVSDKSEWHCVKEEASCVQLRGILDEAFQLRLVLRIRKYFVVPAALCIAECDAETF